MPDRPPVGAFVVLGASQIPRARTWLTSTSDRDLLLVGIEDRGADADPTQTRDWVERFAPCDSPTAVLSALADELGDLPVRGVVVLSEKWVLTGATVCEALGISGPGLRAAHICRDKSQQRRVLDFCSPAWRMIGPNDRDRLHELGFPLVLKPLDGFGSSGVVRVEGVEQAAAAWDSYRPDEIVLAERLVHGDEYTVESVVREGQVRWRGMTAKRTNEGSGSHFVELGHTVGSVPAAVQEHVAAVDDRVVAAIGFSTGILHSEYRASADGVVLMETNARCPGDAIVALHGLAEGRPLTSVLVDVQLGLDPVPASRRIVARQIYFDHPVGRLVRVRCTLEGVDVRSLEDDGWWQGAPGDDLVNAPRVLDLMVAGRPGRLLGPIVNSSTRCTTALIAGPDVPSVEALEKQLRAGVHIDVEPVR